MNITLKLKNEMSREVIEVVRKHEDLTFTAFDDSNEDIFAVIELYINRETLAFKLESPVEEHIKIEDSLTIARLTVIAITAALDHVEKELFPKSKSN